MDKKTLTETEVRTRYITPAIQQAGWDLSHMREEFYYFTDGQIVVRGKSYVRKKRKFVDYLLMRQDGTNTPLAIVEAKDNRHAVGDGMQQALEYAEALDVPFVFTSNGDSFMMHDRTGLLPDTEKQLSLGDFPHPDELDQLYRQWKGLEVTPGEKTVTKQPYHDDGSDKTPRYYQRVAINRTLEAIERDQKRILLVMATGTGKTFTAAQIIWRFWKAPSHTGKQKRILFLADRNILVDQTRSNDFKHFGTAMTKITGRNIEKEYEIYLSLYQAISGNEEARNAYKEFDKDFFDLIVVDECHRGSAKEDSNWREILNYFSSATQIGLTATPIETKVASSSEYFGDPIYTYSLKQGIDDGFLAPYKVIRVATDVDTFGYRPEAGEVDDDGNEIEDKEWTTRNIDRDLILPERDKAVARYITKFLEKTDPYAKTIVFARNINHAERLRQALVNENPEQVRENYKYIMRITGDDEQGKAELDNFIDPESKYPVIAVTSELMSTGVDAQTCKVIVLDSNIESMTKFKQVIGRGTRVNEDYNKSHFTILDFRNVTKLFADPAFDGDPVRVFEPRNENEFDSTIDIIDDEYPSEITDPIFVGENDRYDGTAIQGGDTGSDGGYKPKVHIVSGKRVEVIGDSVRVMDADGKLITESLTDYTRKNILGEYSTLDEFLQTWNKSKQKYHILDEMAEKGIPIYELAEQFDDGIDIFDIVMNIAYGQRTSTRKTRAEKARQSMFVNQYQGKAREVLNALIDKYETASLKAIEERDILKVQPLDKLGTPIEIANLFGGAEGYSEAVSQLTNELYEIGA